MLYCNKKSDKQAIFFMFSFYTCMLLCSVQNNNPNFTSTKLGTVKIKKIVDGVTRIVKADFTKLDPNIAEDKKAIMAIRAEYLDIIDPNTTFYAIEVPELGNTVEKRAVGISKVIAFDEQHGNFLQLQNMDTRSDFRYSNTVARKFQGIGQAMFAKICSMAVEASKNLHFYPMNQRFFNCILDKVRKVYELRMGLIGNYTYRLRPEECAKCASVLELQG